VIGTYAAVVAICGASLAIGQAAIALCGIRRWSWLSPAVGLALVCAICWASVRMPGHGVISAIVILVLTIVAVIYLHGRIETGEEALRVGIPVAIGALLSASLPFAVEGHFGILGTGFNPDMSQHLLATDRLAHGSASQLLHQGYPLGPHSVVVALGKGLGIGIVQDFSGLTIAAAVLAPLTALAAFADQPPLRRTAAALLVGLPYLVASYFAQGAFKEVIQALFVLAFVLALRESTRTWRHLTLRYVPAALIAIGSVYTYSFPGLIWLAAIAAIWGTAELVLQRVSAGGAWVGGSVRKRRPVFRPTNSTTNASSSGEKPSARTDPPTQATGPAATRALSLAVLVLAIGALPELGRMIDFHSFETFDPNGPGLGNLFGQISPFTTLGIWPSGDFRLAPGDGAVPGFVYYLGAAFATVLLLIGVRRAWRDGDRAILAGLVSVIALYVASRLGGTPYTSAKALEVASPVLALAILLPLTAGGWRFLPGMREKGARRRPRTPVALGTYFVAAGVCSLLAFANAPIGPTSYSPALTGLRPLLAEGSTLVLAPDSLLADEQGERYIAWELRGGRVCIEPASAAGGRPPTGIRFFVTSDSPARPPFSQLALRRHAGPYTVWERRGVIGAPSPCPLIAVRQARQGP
jgi:hypothetical protein